MTVAELIIKLKKMPRDAECLIVYDSAVMWVPIDIVAGVKRYQDKSDQKISCIALADESSKHDLEQDSATQAAVSAANKMIIVG